MLSSPQNDTELADSTGFEVNLIYMVIFDTPNEPNVGHDSNVTF